MDPLRRCGREVSAERERFAADLQRYSSLEAEIRRRNAGKPGLPFYLMTLRYGMAEARAIVDWADETLRSLDELVSRQEARVEER